PALKPTAAPQGQPLVVRIEGAPPTVVNIWSRQTTIIPILTLLPTDRLLREGQQQQQQVPARPVAAKVRPPARDAAEPEALARAPVLAPLPVNKLPLGRFVLTPRGGDSESSAPGTESGDGASSSKTEVVFEPPALPPLPEVPLREE